MLAVIKVLHIIATLDVGGAERQLVELVKRLDKRKFLPVVCCLRRKGALSKELTAAGIKSVCLGKRGKFDPLLIFRLVQLILRERPAIVHTWMFTANTYGRIAAVLAGTPVIIASERCVDLWKRWYHFWIDKILLYFTDRVVAVSEGTKRFYQTKLKIPKEKIVVISNGIDLERFPAHHLSPLPEKQLILAVGRLAPQKGFKYLVRAAAEVKKNFPEVEFYLLGEGPERKSLESEITRLNLQGSFFLLGEVADIRPYLFSATALVLPSLFEGMSNVILEAMAVGKPVVATAIPGNDEVVIDEETGLLVPPANAEGLAAAITRLIQEKGLRERLGRSAQAKISSFRIEKTAERYQKLYCQLYVPKCKNEKKGFVDNLPFSPGGQGSLDCHS